MRREQAFGTFVVAVVFIVVLLLLLGCKQTDSERACLFVCNFTVVRVMVDGKPVLVEVKRVRP
jgi:hypothetical protein